MNSNNECINENDSLLLNKAIEEVRMLQGIQFNLYNCVSSLRGLPICSGYSGIFCGNSLEECLTYKKLTKQRIREIAKEIEWLVS